MNTRKFAPILRAAALIPALGSPAIAQPGPNGQQLFTQRCQVCHTNVPGKAPTMGPNLAGVVDRKAGSTSFSYSPALKGANVVWTQANLDKWLSGPTKFIPGVRMMTTVPDVAERSAIINYLATGK